VGSFNNRRQVIRGSRRCNLLKDILSLICNIARSLSLLIKSTLFFIYCLNKRIDFTTTLTLIVFHCTYCNSVTELQNNDELNILYLIYCSILLILSGDIEKNPGPILGHENCLSLLHQNIRGIRHKLDYIVDNFLDYDSLCFT